MAQLLARPSELRPWRFELKTGVANAFYYLELAYSKRSVLKKEEKKKRRSIQPKMTINSPTACFFKEQFCTYLVKILPLAPTAELVLCKPGG